MIYVIAYIWRIRRNNLTNWSLEWSYKVGTILMNTALFLKVLVETVQAHHLEPHPAQISQKEKQLVRYRGNAYLYR